jgi:hypothetical protein
LQPLIEEIMWIQSHQELGRHPKTRRAARQLQTSVPALIGHLHLLWHWCLDFAPHGDLARYDAEQIAEAALWEGDAAQFVQAMTDCGFLDVADNAFTVHDWSEYSGRLIQQRERDAERKKTSRGGGFPASADKAPAERKPTPSEIQSAAPEVLAPSAGCPVEVRRTSAVREEKRREEESREECERSAHARESDSAGNSASEDGDAAESRGDIAARRAALQEVVLEVTGKKLDWEMGSVSPLFQQHTAKLLAKLDRDGRTPDDVRAYRSRLPTFLRRPPENVTPPTPGQMLDHFDAVFATDERKTDGKTSGKSDDADPMAKLAAAQRARRERQPA